ncbi:peptidoglycan-binding protein [Streptomyces kunmingensis]|uniref:Peptidoglycan-binding protein n=1 Tax=Streptomyces kunmingensis TaxID=68225 RepID=A0ABU6CCZ1_9ACTN|nr:peptidoglycan-binding protein [Streptomyces kunmingensis]MEB3962590.1 peptidoglycan-binding protein [Streptomyces kunmingensis]
METPFFEEIDPADDCGCAGCVQWRGAVPHPVRTRIGARHALIVAAAAGTVVGGLQLTPATAAEHHEARPGDPGPDGTTTPQGGSSPLHGAPGTAAQTVHLAQQAALRTTTRASIINRAKTWVAAKVPYDMNKFWKDGYRQDCSGYVSMAWDLPGNEWTGSLAAFGTRITKAELQPGDILLFHNPANPEKGSHVTIFGGWTDYTRSSYIAYEQTRPGTRRQSTPYAYWSNSSRYLAYRYKGVRAGSTAGSGSSAAATKFPGVASFGPGADNAYVTQLGRLLVERGGKRFYEQGPSPRWSDADRRATQAFQKAQGWTGKDADGLPGPTTWSYLVHGTGKDIPGGGSTGTRAPAFPGAAKFRPGASNSYVTQLGKQLVKKGFGKYYTQGPGPRWREADRRNVEAFQRAQGWRGNGADGYPGPETWQRLFS